MDYIGTMAVEFFVVRGKLLVNEMAPRPHNSGHYTLDACATDQFEQQVRALAGLPLGESRLLSPVSMVNLLGEQWATGEPHWDRALADPRVHLHLYGKMTPRPGRKMGHITALAPTPAAALDAALAARAALHPKTLRT
jgi:5-(carboxyamino)imidazole ribonucleotide synthase